jgi:glyoxylase-like metal-dependent hydrolase (beta-lactamase superfamily II)
MDTRPFEIEDVATDVARLRIGFVNVYFVGSPLAVRDAPGTPWVLVDAGLAVGAAQILELAAGRYGESSRPAAIILTHGHFDHVGALEALLHVWDVPVYAHTLELPFLTGRADYPPPDAVAGVLPGRRLSPLLLERGIDLDERVRPLPANRSVPGMPGWRWLHTPGHSPGHVSFYRESTRTLIAGDAVTSTRPESVFSASTQKPELHGPPPAFTLDWQKARRSVMTLGALHPFVVATGHGQPLRGPQIAHDLATLTRDFERRERPPRGRYVSQPAITDEGGVIGFPPAARSAGVRWGALSGVAAGAFAATWLYRRFGRKTSE